MFTGQLTLGTPVPYKNILYFPVRGLPALTRGHLYGGWAMEAQAQAPGQFDTLQLKVYVPLQPGALPFLLMRPLTSMLKPRGRFMAGLRLLAVLLLDVPILASAPAASAIEDGHRDAGLVYRMHILHWFEDTAPWTMWCVRVALSRLLKEQYEAVYPTPGSRHTDNTSAKDVLDSKLQLLHRAMTSHTADPAIISQQSMSHVSVYTLF